MPNTVLSIFCISLCLTGVGCNLDSDLPLEPPERTQDTTRDNMADSTQDASHDTFFEPDMPKIVPELCGNGRLDPAEECDDANTDAGDGCSSSCALEGGYACPPQGPPPCLKPRRVQVVAAPVNEPTDIPWPGASPEGVIERARCSGGDLFGNVRSNGELGHLTFLIAECKGTRYDSDDGVLEAVAPASFAQLGDVSGSGTQAVGCDGGTTGRSIIVYVDADDQVVGFGIYCEFMQIQSGQAYLPPDPNRTTFVIGQNTGDTMYELECDPGQVAVGITGLFTGSIPPRTLARVGLICDTPIFEF